MEPKTMSGGMFTNRNPETLGLEMSLHHHIPLPQNPSHMPQQHPQHPAIPYNHNEGDYHPQTQKCLKQGYPFSAVKSKNQSLTLSDDDEPGVTADNSADDGKKKMSPWHRMKWTDDMVRLLIMVVFYIGDEVSPEGNDPAANKKKSGGALQKKGKWKSVSQALMERGSYVSPQQCEDKFNDLNKRYKRVNDILGKGTACQVVENQSLLDSMDHLSPKLKEEVKKLLNSKHLFFREMCAYHNSCGHGGSTSGSGIGIGTGGIQHSPPDAAQEPPQDQLQLQQQTCLHSSGNIPVMSSLKRGESKVSNLAKVLIGEEDDEEDDDDEEEDVGDEVIGEESRFHDQVCYDDTNEMDELPMRKRERKGTFHSPLIQQLDADLTNMLRDGMKSGFEKRQWMKTKLMQLEEHSVAIQYQTLELEKQRLKWLKFSTKKERELEREKLMNEQLKLENERMVLLIRRKELDFLDYFQQQPPSNKKNDPSPMS